VVSGLLEADFNLRVGLRLRRDLRARGYCVTMTRTRTEGRSMGNVARARIANRARAALFLRIHADGSTDRSRRGTSTLYPARRAGWTDDILPASRTAAAHVQRELVRALGSRDLGLIERGDLTGFNWADVPSILVEVGYMSNPAEDRRLATASYQRRAAKGMAEGVARFVRARSAAPAAGP
jgi:N-acetylmuramoyl-L-alanine amidase